MTNSKTYGLTHLAIAVKDVERTLKFYQSVFDMEVMYHEKGFLQLTTPGCNDILVFEEKKDAPKKVWAVLNPEIVKPSEETLMGVEGCLSIPGLVGEVERHASLQIKGLNRHGKPLKIKAEGWLARIFQHEIDHLNGVMFTDRAIRVWKPEDEVDVEQEV